MESFRTGAYDLREVPLATLLLATDGYGNAQADEPWQPGVGRDLAELAAERDHTGSSSRCPAGRSAARRPRAAETTPRSRCCYTPASMRGHADAEGALKWTD